MPRKYKEGHIISKPDMHLSNVMDSVVTKPLSNSQDTAAMDAVLNSPPNWEDVFVAEDEARLCAYEVDELACRLGPFCRLI